jgi:hypothetical protein
VLLPKEAPRRWINTFNREETSVTETGEVKLERLFENFPVALLSNETNQEKV